MEEIYGNVEELEPVHQTSATDKRGSTSTQKRLCLRVLISLGVLDVFLLAGIAVFGVCSYSLAANLFYNENNLNKRLQISYDKYISMREERDHLNFKLDEQKRHLKYQCFFTLQRTCPAEWVKFDCSCYFFSTKSASWDEGRKDCRDRGADLIVVNDDEEQKFLSLMIAKEFWIGLTDKENEGSWKWVDGTPLKQLHWGTGQPNNGGGYTKWGKEDCVYATKGGWWNDYSCTSSNIWICEKPVMFEKSF